MGSIDNPPIVRPSFSEAARYWARLGWIAFGGPSGQIAILHEELVERRRWIAEEDFLGGLNYCMMLPGPEIQQFATYLGWRLHGVRGAAAAGLLFFLPAMILLWALSLLYVEAGAVPLIAAVFSGLGAGILAIVVRALVLMARRTLQTPLDFAIALAAGVVMGFHGNYPLVVLGAALVGLLVRRTQGVSPLEVNEFHPAIRPRRLAVTASICAIIWLAPLLVAGALLPRGNPVVAQGVFFAKTALVTFGGAYAVLPYVTQHAVGHGWLSNVDMLHGVSLAGAIPGPLVIVVQFVAFITAWHHPDGWTPLVAATFASLLASWVTFTPSFFYILVGGPFILWLRRVAALQRALRAVSAAVVGVMAGFAVWFAGNALFPAARQGHFNGWVLVMAAAALMALVRFRVGVGALLAACAVGGVIVSLLP